MAIKPPLTLLPRDLAKMSSPTQNIYATTLIIAKRTKQLVAKNKMELTHRLEEFIVPQEPDNLEEIFDNKEQIEFSRFYEQQPKPLMLATEEFLNDQLTYRYAVATPTDTAAEATEELTVQQQEVTEPPVKPATIDEQKTSS